MHTIYTYNEIWLLSDKRHDILAVIYIYIFQTRIQIFEAQEEAAFEAEVRDYS